MMRFSPGGLFIRPRIFQQFSIRLYLFGSFPLGDPSSVLCRDGCRFEAAHSYPDSIFVRSFIRFHIVTMRSFALSWFSSILKAKYSSRYFRFRNPQLRNRRPVHPPSRPPPNSSAAETRKAQFSRIVNPNTALLFTNYTRDRLISRITPFLDTLRRLSS